MFRYELGILTDGVLVPLYFVNKASMLWFMTHFINLGYDVQVKKLKGIDKE